MNLEELFSSQKDTVIFLIDDEGVVLQSYPKLNDYEEIKNKVSIFSKVILNMSSDFFQNFFNANVKELMLKSDGKHLYLNKINEDQFLCFVSERPISTAMLALVIKKLN